MLAADAKRALRVRGACHDIRYAASTVHWIRTSSRISGGALGAGLFKVIEKAKRCARSECSPASLASAVRLYIITDTVYIYRCPMSDLTPRQTQILRLIQDAIA